MRAAPSGVVSFAVVVLACAPAEREGEGPAPPVVVSQRQDVVSLDPVVAADNPTRSVLTNVYEGLVDLDGDMALKPALAVGWNSLDDQTWEFHVRRDVRFHDGRPLRPEDVVWSLDRARQAAESDLRDKLANVASVQIVNGRVRVRTTQPDALLLTRMTEVMIVPERASGLAEVPIGTGPWRFVAREPGTVATEAFAGHWAGPPPFAGARFTALDDEALAGAFGRGEVDVARSVRSTVADEIARVPGARIVGRPGLSSIYLWMDSRPRPDNPFAHRGVRQALSLAIDRAEMVRRQGGQNTPAEQLVPPGVHGFVPGWRALEHDPERARALLASAGYPEGFATTLHVSSIAPSDAESLTAMLAAVGIRLTIQRMDWREFVRAGRAGELPFYAVAWRFDNADAWTFAREVLYTDLGPGPRTNPGFSSPELDQLIQETQRLLDTPDRLRRTQEILRQATEEMPIVPLYNRHDLYAVSSRVRFEPRLDGMVRAAAIRPAR